MKHIEVVAAIIINKNKILTVQRNISKYEYISLKYEFPGGKVELGETQEEALKREILEELKLTIDIGGHFLTINHTYPDFVIKMHSFICQTDESSLTLTEHVDSKWLKKDELMSVDWAAADIPIVEKLMHE